MSYTAYTFSCTYLPALACMHTLYVRAKKNFLEKEVVKWRMQFLICLRKTSCAQHRYKYSVRCLYSKSGGAGHGTVALNAFIHCESFEYSYNIIYVVSNPTWKSCCSLLLI